MPQERQDRWRKRFVEWIGPFGAVVSLSALFMSINTNDQLMRANVRLKEANARLEMLLAQKMIRERRADLGQSN